MIPEYPQIMSFRMSTAERDLVDQLIQDGKFRSISELIREAIKQFLAKEGQHP